MSGLLDVNVLLALAWPNHVHHAVARGWFTEHHRSGWATCSVTEAGFVRVSSNRRVTPDARTPGEAALLLGRMRAIGGHQFVTDTISLAEHHETVRALAHSSALVTDLHLILIAQSAGHRFITFDRAAAEMADALDTPCELLRM